MSDEKKVVNLCEVYYADHLLICISELLVKQQERTCP